VKNIFFPLVIVLGFVFQFCSSHNDCKNLKKDDLLIIDSNCCIFGNDSCLILEYWDGVLIDSFLTVNGKINGQRMIYIDSLDAKLFINYKDDIKDGFTYCIKDSSILYFGMNREGINYGNWFINDIDNKEVTYECLRFDGKPTFAIMETYKGKIFFANGDPIYDYEITNLSTHFYEYKVILYKFNFENFTCSLIKIDSSINNIKIDKINTSDSKDIIWISSNNPIASLNLLYEILLVDSNSIYKDYSTIFFYDIQ
jgi:hypothetical protein